MPSPARLIRLHWTLLIALCVALGVGFATPGDWRWPTRAALGWDIGVDLFLLISAIKMIRTRSTDQIRQRAAEMDDAGSAVLPLSLVAALASVAIVVGEAATAPPHQAASSAALVLTSVALSWCFIHLMFAQHYAHGFYGPGTTASGAKSKKQRGGLLFPGEDEPDYWDFIHFSLIIGVACQTADVQIADRSLRRISSIHSVTAFVFNTVILALGVNFAVSLLG
ncbi:MAG: hypothetical protein JWR59_1605 [Brevundimonas sp.]|nr:hypothetical protein [Brevundimonas sp.]